MTREGDKTDLICARIICRAFQGVGGAGVYSLTLFSFVRIVPYRQYDTISSVAGGILSLGLVLGPLIGGAVAEKGSWRWVFLCKYARLISTIIHVF